MDKFEKVVYAGKTRIGHREADVFVKIQWDGTRLSMTGVEGPKSNGDAVGSCGQLSESPKIMGDLDEPTVMKMFEIWKEHHLNDMRPYCAHQKKLGWHKRRIDGSKPSNAYGKHFDGQKSPSWNLAGWVYPAEHHKGVLCKPCPECGYKYGSEWKTEPVPNNVLEFLASLPETTK